jgi:hypothetical protein
MTLAPSLTSPAALYRKLEREAYRAYHSRRSIHKADHFFNFCVTAHAMRDYVLEHLGKTNPEEKQLFHSRWDSISALIAVQEIANSSKHFVLRIRKTERLKVAKTKAVQMRKSVFIDIYANSKGEFKVVPVEAPDVSVKLSDGNAMMLHQFTREVMEHWRKELSKHGIAIRRQSLSQLIGNG